ncbi:MAG TPA: OmpA family protein [Bryobacteraceae bacterium]|nr:OmpA family protein [Bryobacteraceae bacterium]
MKCQRYATLLGLFFVFTSSVFAQGVNTTASKDDWEEINFEFNSPILTDGYPSLLRLSEVLQQNPGYKVKLEGHADVIGSTRYNQRLGERRAQAVREFLIKYGANAGQISVQSYGETQPKITNRSREARFMNRRVFMTVTDEAGRVISAGGINDALKAMKDLMAAQQKCCDEILKRLDRLDQIADMLRKMATDNESLRSDLADLRKAHDALDQYVKATPKPLTRAETTEIVDTRTAEQIERARMPRFSILGLNAGSDQSGNLTFTGRGRYFMPFKEQFAVQMQGEYMYHRDRQEGQFDAGLVNRFATRAQAGIFASFKHVNFSGRDPGRNIFTDRPVTQFQQGQITGQGMLGQASATVDYLFGRGRLGIFGTKAFLNDAVINRIALSRNVFTEYYLRAIDQVGVSTTVGMFGDSYLEGNIGYLKSQGNADRLGGTARLIFPLSDRFAFTLEGGMNETLLSRDNTGRVVAGFQFGNFMRPRDYMEGYNGVRHAVPTDVPRVRYEVLNRTARTGNDAPVANAGPDQIGVPAGQINLDASGSSDPDGDAITFQWVQVSGPAVSLAGMNTARATFTAEEGQSYGFRVIVRDDQGQQGVDTVTVTTGTTQPVSIVRFQAVPDRIRSGEQSTLDWQVQNAESVTITNIGPVQPNGQRAVTPTQTTQYRLTARNPRGEVSAVATVTVEQAPQAQFVACTASPTTILQGESTTITWNTANADSVTLSGETGNIGAAGSRTVSPTQNTTYTLTATNARGPVTCTLNVQVTQGQVPRIISFSGNPTTITEGQSSTLTWNVENADTVEISGLGTVTNTGTRQVTPTTTTTYTLTARNRFGQVTGTAALTVNARPVDPTPAPTLTACVASPTSVVAGNPVQISYTAANAQSVTFSPAVAGATLAGPVSVTPTATTTYTITATGTNNRTATCSVNVTVTPVANLPTVVIAGGPIIETIQRNLTLDASASTDPAGGALTYTWDTNNPTAAILDQGQARTRVYLGALAGDYTFRVTARNAQGASNTATITVRFKSTNVYE